MNYHRIRNLALTTLITACCAGVALAQPAAPMTNAPSPWTSSAAVGVTLARGNSDTTTLSVTEHSERKWGINDLNFGAEGLYGTQKEANASKNTETADLLHGFVQYNRAISDRFDGYGRADGLHDGLADIQYRLTLSPGAAYHFIKEKKTDLSLEIGPGWIDEKLGHSYRNFAVLRGAEKFRQTLSDRSRLWETLEILPQVDHFNNYIANFELGIEGDLNERKTLSLRVTLDDTYNNVPAAGRLKNDLKLIAAIAYKF